MRRENYIALAMILAFIVIFGYGFYPSSTSEMATVDNGIRPDGNYVAASEAVIWTDKDEYGPGEMAVICGSGFTPDSIIDLNVTRPDGAIDKGSNMSDAQGGFVYVYDLDGIEGIYIVNATDGVNWAGTAFADSFEWWLGYRLPEEIWKNANLAPQYDYRECDWVPYQLIITDQSKIWKNGFAVDGSIDIGWNFWDEGKDSVFVDMLGAFYYKWDTDSLPDGDPGSTTKFELGFDTSTHPGWTSFDPAILNRPGTYDSETGLYKEVPETDVSPENDHFIRLTPGVNGFPANTEFGGSHTRIVIYFQAHLALDALWRNGEQANLPADLAGTLYLGPDETLDTADDWTYPHHGSSYGPGASSNFKLQFKNFGAKTIPIPIAAYPEGVIQGYKYVDVNGDGTRNDGDYAYPDGWGIGGTATITFNGLFTTTFDLEDLTTDLSGFYSYTGIIEGTYTIDEEERLGWEHTNVETGISGVWDEEEGAFTFDFTEPGAVVYISFLNTPYGDISGYKWHDVNGDGIWDKDTEPALDSWTIELRDAGTNDVIATAITGDTSQGWETGYYIFTEVSPGDYILTEDIGMGYTTTHSPDPITLNAGDHSTNNNFGNFEWLTISGTKYDTEGTGLSGWWIELWRYDDVLEDYVYYADTTTDGDGNYFFTVM
ncbi:MAG: collagen binding domain-containing protein, partial [Promethearchaeota archaeon]